MATRIELAAQRNIDALTDLARDGGIVAKSAWKTGSGNYGKSREIPEGAAEYNLAAWAINTAPAAVQAWATAHPRAERCVALTPAGAELLSAKKAAVAKTQKAERAAAWAAA